MLLYRAQPQVATGSEFFSLLDCKKPSFGVEISATTARVEFMLHVTSQPGTKSTSLSLPWSIEGSQSRLQIKVLETSGAPLHQALRLFWSGINSLLEEISQNVHTTKIGMKKFPGCGGAATKSDFSISAPNLRFPFIFVPALPSGPC